MSGFICRKLTAHVLDGEMFCTVCIKGFRMICSYRISLRCRKLAYVQEYVRGTVILRGYFLRFAWAFFLWRSCWRLAFFRLFVFSICVISCLRALKRALRAPDPSISASIFASISSSSYARTSGISIPGEKLV